MGRLPKSVRSIGWLKTLILPAAKAHTSRKIAASALIAGAISGFRFVQPIDDPAKSFRTLCLFAGGFGFFWLIVLSIFPPRT